MLNKVLNLKSHSNVCFFQKKPHGVDGSDELNRILQVNDTWLFIIVGFVAGSCIVLVLVDRCAARCIGRTAYADRTKGEALGMRVKRKVMA